MELKIKDICALIKICGESKVKELKFGDLHVVFAPEALGQANQVLAQSTKVFSGQVVSDEAEAFQQDEVKIKDLKLEMALIENPAEYEQMVLAGELEDGETTQYR